MRKLFAWLGVAMLASMIAPTTARAGEPLKPYVVLVLDTSGSMVGTSFGNPTGSGPPSCGGIDNKLNHAKCAINNIVNSYGDMVFGLARFRATLGGTTTTNTFPAGCCVAGANIAANGACAAGPTCNAADHMVQMLSPLVDGDNQLAGAWTNGSANSCTTAGTDPEIWDDENLCSGGDGTCGGATPLGGSLLGTKRYWQGLQATNGTTIWPNGGPATGFDPIRNDPKKTNFIPKGGETTCNPNGATCNAAANCTGANCCCVEQCRPYIVILLTDGDETCGGNAPTAAASLLASDVDNRRYRIETKPIGFGVSGPTQTIEDIAHSGGAPDVPNQSEGYYANDEASLQLAISAILDDAIKTEVCNNLDDDCDTLIDEDFPTKGGTCDNGKLGVCRRTGSFVCRADGTGVTCNAPVGPNGSPEVCNNLDDDCDGKVDEDTTGCSCSPQAEQCDNDDDDCDTQVDEDLTRPCGTGTCPGTETCTAGNWGGCTAQTPQTETCNGLDDNCDGVRDGFTLDCSTMPPLPPENFPVDDPRNNPGHPSNNPIPENICHPGQKTCPANIGPPNNFGACLAEQKPRTEVCNGLDDDCDNKIDEGTGGGDCSSTCGTGTIVCRNGMLECDSVQQPNDDTCNNNDDDCDGNVDEDWVCANPPNCDCTATGQCNAHESCSNGVVVCAGQPISQESCNCGDDDCDGNIDEGTLCSGGATCTSCQCALPCANEEFPCPEGKFCEGGFCIQDPCFDKDCPPVNGNHQTCRPVFHTNPPMAPTSECVDTCDITTCDPGYVCIDSTGQCVPDNCITYPERCTDQQACVNGVCVDDLCANVECTAPEYCVGGNCVASCDDIDCPDGERCRMGVCEPDPCSDPCPQGEVCHDETGQCVPNNCDNIDCPVGQWCNPNHNSVCEEDPCVRDHVVCPDPTDVCYGGTCIDPTKIDGEHVTTGGGGGCNSSSGAGALSMIGFAVMLLFRRRRPAQGGQS